MRFARTRTPDQAATLFELNDYTHYLDTGRSITRSSYSPATVRIITGYDQLETSYLRQLEAALLRRGYGSFMFRDHMYLVECSSAISWQRISSKRIKTELDELAEIAPHDKGAMAAFFAELEERLEKLRSGADPASDEDDLTDDE